jgi:hypothetical protein
MHLQGFSKHAFRPELLPQTASNEVEGHRDGATAPA